VSFFGWIEEAEQIKEARVALKERLHETTAYRINLDRLIKENMADYDELDKEHRRVSHLEDELSDTLEKMPR